MKDLIICKDPITGKFVSGYKIVIKAEDYPVIHWKPTAPFTFTLEPDYVNKNLFDELTMPK